MKTAETAIVDTADTKNSGAEKGCVYLSNRRTEKSTQPILKHRKHNIEQEGNVMKKIQKFAPYMVAAVILLSLGGCAGMSSQDKNTAIGAGVGAVGGAILTGGSTMGTVGGAAVGGVIGHEVSKDKDK